ncbi:MAG: peroxidase [Planctomycetales bacterium]|nr:peroxidase [Planctomycetales bacterium]
MFNRSRKETRRRLATQIRSAIATAAECSETRVLLSAAALDGTGNNIEYPEWGSTEEAMLRLAEAEYADAISAVGGEDRPSARLISNAVSDSGGNDEISKRLMSAMTYAWGQFIDHDMTLTSSAENEKMSIAVPKGDPSFDPAGTGTKTIDTMRSAFDESIGTDANNPRQQVNLITSFIDASMVYGSNSETAASLRTLTGGKMKTSEGDLLPVGDDGQFEAGDIRANENPGLISLQTLFVREHNLQASRIAASNAKLTDEQVYQQARSIIAAEIQAITYNEWLPSLLGRGALEKYDGYDSSVNPGISNEFATAAFRFGHSLLGDDVGFLDDNGLPVRDEVSLAEAFFNTSVVKENGIDSALKYLASDPSMEVDTEVVEGVRNFLFGPPGAGGLDLASLNIQRGRDHGLADYNDTREAIGLSRVTSFAEITSDKALQAKLESLYGSVDEIDLWVGGLAEDHVRGSSVGETFQTIIVDQFERLRDGDRFWYQNQFSGRQLAQLQKTSLSDVIERNTDLTSIQKNAFFFRSEVAGVITTDLNRNKKSERNEPPVARIKVQLIDSADGAVVATTTTDRNGHYRFGVQNGLRTGVYQVRALKADGTVVTTSRRISITAGDDNERVDLSAPAPAKPSGPTTPPAKSGRPGPTQSVASGQGPGSENRTTISGTTSGAVDASNSVQGANGASQQVRPAAVITSSSSKVATATKSSLGSVPVSAASTRQASTLNGSEVDILADSLFADWIRFV